MNSRNYKYALLLVAAVSITATGAMSQAYAQSVDDGMDGYVAGTSGIYTGNPNECWYDRWMKMESHATLSYRHR